MARALNASVDLPALLAQALEKVAELLGLDTGWVLLFDEATGERLPPAVEAGLYRIAEEALRNAVTHAGAKRVLVHFERTVKFHVSSVIAKLGAKNRTEAVHHARERGLLPA